LGGPDEIPVSACERTRRAESRLGEPTKQNAGERRARLGLQAVKRSKCPIDPVSRIQREPPIAGELSQSVPMC